MGTSALIEHRSSERPGVAFRAPVASLLVMTLALNILGLSVPLAAQLIFNRILPSPGSSTLIFIVAGMLVLGILEAIIRLARSFIILNADRVVTTDITRNLFHRILASDYSAGIRGSARCLDYFTRIAQVTEKQSGKLLVGLAELMFLPVILILIFFIAPMAGLLITLSLLGGSWITWRGATSLRRNSALLNRLLERRYRFLLSILGAIHPLKALGIEDYVLRRFDHVQTGLARTSMKTAISSSELLNGVTVTNQTILITTLIYGAYSINQGTMTLGALSAVILLGARLIVPMQRAVFIFTQARDLCEAEDVVADVMRHKPQRTVTEEIPVENIGKLELADVSFECSHARSSVRFYRNIDLRLEPGETIALSGPSDEACTVLLKIMAGVERPLEGTMTLDGAPLDAYPAQQLNRAVAYASGDPTMFHGTIRDNITRFGEIPVDQAMSIAALMDLQTAINELPRGLDTPVNGSVTENVPSGLCQQLSILRALAHRPRLILLDNVDRGLDRAGYARLQRFIATIQGQATLVIVSQDRNMTAGAQRRLELTSKGIRTDYGVVERNISTYRTLKL